MEITVECTRDRFTLAARVIGIGDDLLVVVSGGRAHIGAVALAQPAQSHLYLEKVYASTSVLPVMGHQEDVVVQKVAHHLCKAFTTNVVVLAGIHWDDLAPAEIACVLDVVDDLRGKIVEAVQVR